MRKSKEELNEIKKDLNIDKLWSFSAIDTFLNSKYSYFLKYIKHTKPDNEDNIYGIMGGLIHDTIESFYKKEISFKELLEKFENFWLVNVDTLDIRFDRTDRDKNEKIKTKYYECLRHFMINHQKVELPMITEQFLLIKIGKYYFQGYIDSCVKNDDGVFTIIDWKTSSIYKNQKLKEKSKQLLLYAYGLYQKGKLPIDKIKCCFNFLKYVNVDIEQINGKIKTRQIERNQIGNKLQNAAKTWLKKFKYNDEEISQYLVDMELNNSIDTLPNVVKEKIKISDCYVYVDINEQVFKELENELIDIIDDINQKEAQYNITLNDHIFWDDFDEIKKQEYYYYNLCDYSPNLNKPFKEYLDQLEKNKNGVDLLDIGTQKSKDDNTLDWINELF